MTRRYWERSTAQILGKPMKLRFRLTPAAGLLLGLGFFSQASYAGTVCDSAEAAKYLPPLPRGCQPRRIEATGGLSFGIILSPERRAEAAWRRQVVFFFGERYQDWNKAACKKVFCVHPLIRGSRRCTYSAFPCAADMDTKLLEALNKQQPNPPEPLHDEVRRTPVIKQPSGEPSTAPDIKQARDEALTAAEIKEMQELLAEAGYRVLADGVFGGQTKNALTKWQQRRGLPDNGTASRENLEKLRRMPGAMGINPGRGRAHYRPRDASGLRWRRMRPYRN